jgi:hypothetical protein
MNQFVAVGFRAIASLLLVVGVSNSAVFADDANSTIPSAAASDAGKAIDPAKRDLILRFIKANGDERSITSGMNSVIANMSSGYEMGIKNAVLSDDKIPADDKQQFIDKRVSEYKRIMGRIQELFNKKCDMIAIGDSVLISTYDKYFTNDDLKVIVTFFESAAGQKMVQALPQMAAEARHATSEIITPKIKAVTEQVVQEESERKAAEPAK